MELYQVWLKDDGSVKCELFDWVDNEYGFRLVGWKNYTFMGYHQSGKLPTILDPYIETIRSDTVAILTELGFTPSREFRNVWELTKD